MDTFVILSPDDGAGVVLFLGYHHKTPWTFTFESECLFLLGAYLGLQQLQGGPCVLKTAACDRSGFSHLLLHMVWSVSGGGGQLVRVVVGHCGGQLVGVVVSGRGGQSSWLWFEFP